MIISFPSGVRVLSHRTGEVLYERGDEPLEIVKGRLVPVRSSEVLYLVLKFRWVRRQLAAHPGLSPRQQAYGRRLKRDLVGASA